MPLPFNNAILITGTVLFNNRQTLKFMLIFFATINQKLSVSSKLRASAKGVVIKSFINPTSDNETVLGSIRKLGGAA